MTHIGIESLGSGDGQGHRAQGGEGDEAVPDGEVDRLQGLRGMYGIASPAPICTDDSTPASGQLDCQIVQAPDSDERLVAQQRLPVPAGGIDGEIRLTYRELTALIEDAIRNLR
jgi:hypothetical protein